MSKLGGGGGVQNPNPDPTQTTTPGTGSIYYDAKKRKYNQSKKVNTPGMARQAALGGPANALKSGKMRAPLIDTSRFKIKKRGR